MYSLPDELLLIFIGYLDLTALLQISQTSSLFQDIIQDEAIWKHRVQVDYGVRKYKPSEINYQKQYQQIYDAVKTPDHLEFVQRNRLDLLIATNFNKCTHETYLQLVSVEIFSYYVKKGSEDMVNIATLNNNVSVVKLMVERGILPSSVVLDIIVEHNKLELANYLYAAGVRPSRFGVSSSIMDENREGVRWMYDHGSRMPYQFYHLVSEKTLFIKWIIENYLYD